VNRTSELSEESPPSADPYAGLTPERLRTKSLGERTVPSPLPHGELDVTFVPEGTAIPLDVEIEPGKTRRDDLAFEKAGPRKQIYFDPRKVRAAIATCGGLCPGLNNVIRSICIQLRYGYGVTNEVLGIPYGYLGMNPANGLLPIPLTPDRVADIHKQGGSIVGSSRERLDPEIAVSFLQRLGINLLGRTSSTRPPYGAATSSPSSACRRPSTTTSRSSGAASASSPRSRRRAR
jgi:6-phosphofructokinase 1